MLDEIIAHKKKLKANGPSITELEEQANTLSRRDIRQIKFSSTLDVIAEIKRKSPSKGHLADIENPEELAQVYEQGGACLISVLTDNFFFGGTIEDLDVVRRSVSIPVLRKDFILDIEDVYETYIVGADALLLIVAAIEDKNLLKQMYDLATSLGLSVLLETHSEEEVEFANSIGAKIVGVNVRDLKTFKELPELGVELVSSLPDDVVKVWESSVTTVDQAQLARNSGADAVLVGQGLVQHENPAHFIKQMRSIT